MKKGDVRGLSTVIATLLIILLVIIAVVIVWGVVRSIIKNSSESISLGKFTIDLEIVKVYPSDGISGTGIKVRRNPGEGELEGIIFSILDDEGNTHIYEKHNVNLNPLEIKTFFVDYHGSIVSVSIYPILLGASGKTLTGGISDTYYYIGGDSGGGYISPGCIPNCTGKTACQDNGCGDNCGLECSENTPYCVQGNCEADSGGIERDCSCQTTTCIGTTCDDGLGGSCLGELTLEESCRSIVCGPSQCEDCGGCDDDYYCSGGMCSPNCSTSDCELRECGGIPGRSECGETICGLCNATAGETCNITTGTCFICDAFTNCIGKDCGDDGCGGDCGDCKLSPFNSSYNCNFNNNLCEMCTPDCNDGEIKCGNSSNLCGECGECTGEDSCIDGICVPPEVVLNLGTIFSVWPINVGIYFDSDNLPKSGVSYTNYWVKLPGSICLQIDKFVTPVIPQIYNMSYIKFVTSSSSIKDGDSYEIWETYEGCTR